MPYNLNIPGQTNEIQHKAIELVAASVPANGIVVEIGSLFGRTSWTWSQSIDPSATIYCIDPWQGNKGVRPIEERYGIKYGIEQFKIYTSDCRNLVAIQGFSPNDVRDWNKQIDIYYEDSVHTNPVLKSNLEFWSRWVKPEGIICGDDYCDNFPDIKNEVAFLAKEMNRQQIIIERFWCLLPKGIPVMDKLLEELLELKHTN